MSYIFGMKHLFGFLFLMACNVEITPGSTSVPTGFVGVRPYTTLPTSNETAAGVDWSTTPTSYRGRNGLRVKFDCPSNGSNGSVWGTDIYTDDSSVCSCAVHFGRISAATGGSVVIEIRPGQSSYLSSTRNGIMSVSYGDWPGSFIVL
jgi:hypothetical protein